MCVSLIRFQKSLDFVQHLLIGEQGRAASAAQVYDAGVDLYSVVEFIQKIE